MRIRARPSSLALTIACNASLQLRESVPPLPETDEEAEGTAAHWVARRYLAGYGHELPVGAKFHSGGKQWEVDHDMHAAAVMYMRALGAPHPTLRIEDTLSIQRIHPTECAGTPDAWNYFADARQAYGDDMAKGIYPTGMPPDLLESGRMKLVRVGDFKFGHRYVDVYENAQLSAYVSGVLDKLAIYDDTDPHLWFELILVQPRCYTREGKVRVWRGQAMRLRPVITAAADAVERSLLTGAFAPTMQTGSHCIDCHARHVCEALLTQTARLVDFAHTYERSELTPAAAGQELAIVKDALKLMEARATGLEAQVETHLRAGSGVPNFALQPGKSVQTYLDNVNVQELIDLGDILGINLRKTLKLKDQVVTPTQAIDLGIDPAVMASYAHRPAGAMKVTRVDPRNIRKVFNR